MWDLRGKNASQRGERWVLAACGPGQHCDRRNEEHLAVTEMLGEAIVILRVLVGVEAGVRLRRNRRYPGHHDCATH